MCRSWRPGVSSRPPVSPNWTIGDVPLLVVESLSVVAGCWAGGERWGAAIAAVCLLALGGCGGAGSLDSYTTVSAGNWHSCAIDLGGEAVCWGSNDSGQADPPDGT
ncbi:MAG: hypothetical protein F4Z70_12660, partial [Acidimicrobiia bacterium]|nr:hypothetical protein [Acidimicrobiia bacterium]